MEGRYHEVMDKMKEETLSLISSGVNPYSRRSLHVVYSMLRGSKYSVIESRHRTEVSAADRLRIYQKYDIPQVVVQDFEAQIRAHPRIS